MQVEIQIAMQQLAARSGRACQITSKWAIALQSAGRKAY